MTDLNGVEVVIGARCRFFVSDTADNGRWIEGTVRAIKRWPTSGNEPHARADDGDPTNEDIRTNGFRYSAWCPGDEVEMLP